MGINYNPKKDVLDLSKIKQGDTSTNNEITAGYLHPIGSTFKEPNRTFSDSVIGVSSGKPTTSKEIKDAVGTTSGTTNGTTGGTTNGTTGGTTGGTTSGSTNNGYKESDSVIALGGQLETLLSQKPGEYNSLWGDTLNETINKLLNGEKFSYDFNEDALYQQYKDKYIKQGKMAMADTIGQASAMTGGYGNSYAQSVGQQAYQASLENLNDIVPELYQMAYDRYNNERQDLYNQYALLSSQENQDYGRYRDSMADWMTERDYATGRYDNERNFDYGKWADDRNYDYGVERDSIADQQWQTQFDEAKRQYDEQMAFSKQQYDDSKKYTTGGGGSSSGGSSGGAGNTGTGDTGTTSTSGIPSDVVKKIEGFTSNKQIQDYALELLAGGYDEAEVDKLVAKHLDVNEKDTYKEMAQSTQGWKVVDNGGGNLLGIDRNAIVEAPNGEKLSLLQLRNKLMEENNISKSKANKIVKKLQQDLGISSNWVFGW